MVFGIEIKVFVCLCVIFVATLIIAHAKIKENTDKINMEEHRMEEEDV